MVMLSRRVEVMEKMLDDLAQSVKNFYGEHCSCLNHFIANSLTHCSKTAIKSFDRIWTRRASHF